MECLICCDIRSVGKLVYLECLHSLCNFCLSKLRQPVCPYCRTVIKEEVINLSRKKNIKHSVVEIQQPIRVHFRQRRNNSRIIHDTFDTEYGEIILETSRKNKSKKGKNNFRKGNWGTQNSHARLRC